MTTNTVKKLVAVACAALALSAPLAAEAHYLSSAQERAIGDEAVQEYTRLERVFEDATLTHVQKRLLQYNPDKLWMYGEPGKKRGLNPILRNDNSHTNAVSFSNGQVFIYDGMIAMLDNKNCGWNVEDEKYRNPWKKSNIYQMSSLAAVVGHEFGHWANEDFLRMYDKQMNTKLIASLIPVGNIWAALGVSVGADVVNKFNSRQMGFRTEQQADEKAMEFSMNVPEFSIGGEAIVQFRDMERKRLNGIPDDVGDWARPHSKTAKRLVRALQEQERQSLGYIKWDGLEAVVDGKPFVYDYLTVPKNSGLTAKEREFYVFGQIATSIHYDICKVENIIVLPENEVFPDGSAYNTTMLLKGYGNDHKEHIKVIDTYHNFPVTTAKHLLSLTVKQRNQRKQEVGKGSEELNFLATRGIIGNFDYERLNYLKNKGKYQKDGNDEPAEEDVG